MATAHLSEELAARKRLPPPPVRKALRLAAGASLEATGEAAGGVTDEAVRLWELGKRTPRGENLRAYVEVLDLFRTALAEESATRT